MSDTARKKEKKNKLAKARKKEKKRKLAKMFAEEFAGEYEKVVKEREQNWLGTLSQNHGEHLDNLQNYTFENRPTVLSRLTKEDFTTLQREMPFFYADENGELHFISLPEIDPEVKKFFMLD